MNPKEAVPNSPTDPSAPKTDYASLLAEAQTKEPVYPSAERTRHIGAAPQAHERLTDASVNAQRDAAYATLVNEAKESLPIEDGPVNIEEGRMVYEKTKKSIETFRDMLLPKLPLNDRLRDATLKISDEILNGDIGILVDNSSTARFLTYTLRDGTIGLDFDGDAVIEMGAEMVDVKSEWTADAVKRAGIDLTDQQISELGFNALVWHELGHGVQLAYTRTAEPNRTNPIWAYPASLPVDAMAHGVTEPYFGPLSAIEAKNVTIDSERFAEGLSQMLVADYAKERFGLDEETAERLREELTPTERKRDVGVAAAITHKHLEAHGGDIKPIELAKELREQLVTINSIGYGTPYGPTKILEIISAANELSGLPWQERIRKN